VTNEKEKLVRSPEMSSTGDEKQETAREKTADDSDEESKGLLGLLEFTVGYDKERCALIVSVMRAKDLPIKNVNIGSSDPYVKLQLLPDKRQKVYALALLVTTVVVVAIAKASVRALQFQRVGIPHEKTLS